MAKLGKPFAVAAFVLCVLFLGLASAVALGGPNWRAKATALTEFTFDPAGDGRYTVRDRVSNTTVATADSYPAAVAAAYEEKAKRLREETAAVQGRVAAVEARIPDVGRINAADTAAAEARLAALREQAARAAALLNEATADSDEANRDATAVLGVARARAEDLARLRTELAATRADRARVESNLAGLEDLLVRLEGALARAERRGEQLRDRLPDAAAE